VFAAESTPFLGKDLLPLLVLALGGALVVGNVLALIRPPAETKDGDLARAPRSRTIAMALVGFVASVWAIGTLVS
jgi:hypothetical protein